MSDTFNTNSQSHYAMEEQFAADMAPATVGKSARIFAMFSLIAFGAIGGYVNANWDSYKEVLGFASATPDDQACCANNRQAPPMSVQQMVCSETRAIAVESDVCVISGKKASCCSQKDELAAATGGEAPCCSQMSKAIVAAMLEVTNKSTATENTPKSADETIVTTEAPTPVAPAMPEEI